MVYEYYRNQIYDLIRNYKTGNGFFIFFNKGRNQSPVACSQSPAGMKGVNPNWIERFSMKDEQNKIISGLFMLAYLTKLFSRLIGFNY